ncbi:MAG: SDR family NAD(P)-dependent oxidoreductase [Kiloniellales bacterium]
MQLSGRIALVTGAGSGIGRAIAAGYAAEGATVIAADVNADGLAETLAAIEAAGGKAQSEICDVAAPGHCEVLAGKVREQFGRLDILVNNAGVGMERAFLETSREDLERILGVNLVGAFEMARSAARIMVDQPPIEGFGAGRIINMGSISGQRGTVGRAAYGASKGGLHSLTQVMAIELAPHRITVNAIAPGPIETALVKAMHSQATRDAYLRNVPLRRYGTAEEVAAAALFLASDPASYITGHVLNVDGGFDATGLIYEMGSQHQIPIVMT